MAEPLITQGEVETPETQECVLEILRSGDPEAIKQALAGIRKAGDKLVRVCNGCESGIELFDDGAVYISKGDKGCPISEKNRLDRQITLDLRTLRIRL